MKPIRRLITQSMGWVAWVVSVVAALLLAGHAAAAVTEHTCFETPELLDLPVVVWAKSLIVQGDGIEASHTQGISIAPAGDGSGNILVTGSAWTDAGEHEYGLVVKMDPSGTLLDAATFFDIAQENGIYAINPTYDTSHMLDGYIAAGYKEASHLWIGGDWSIWPDAWLLKLDLSLDRTWQNTFGMPAEDWANTVIQNDTGYLFGGALRDIGPVPQGGWLFQTDGGGNGLWSKSEYYYCSRNDERDDFWTEPCPEPNISSSADPEANGIIHLLLPTADGSCIGGTGIQKLDSDGSQVWTANGPSAAVIQTGGDFLGAGKVTSGLDSPAIGLAMVSAAGEVIWNAHYGQNASGAAEFPTTSGRSGLGVVEIADGSYIVAGHVEMFDAGSTDLWLIKTLPGTEGEMDWALPLTSMRLHSTRPMMVAADGDLIVAGSVVCDDQPRLMVIKVRVSGLQAPVAAFTMTPAAPYCVDQEIAFDGSASSDPDGPIDSYEWNFGDGTVIDGTDATVTHRFAMAGDYTVTLLVRDDDGLPAFEQQTITVGLPGVLWERIYANTPGCLDQTTCTTGGKAYDIIEGVDGGFAISGRSNFLYSGVRYDAWLLKLFDNGILHWEKNLTNDPEVVEHGSGLTVTVDGGYAVAGNFMPYGGEETDIRTMLIKTDSRGNPAWHRVYTDYAGADEDVVRRRVLNLDNGEYIVGGHRWRDDATYRNMWLLRTDADGGEIPGASRLFPPQETGWNSSVCLSVAPAMPDGFVLTGYYGSQGHTAPLPVLKTDDAGDLDWSFHWPAASWNKKRGFWVAAVADGYVVAGQADSNYGRAAVMKVPADGSASAWVAHVPFVSHGTSGAMDGTLTPDGGVAIVGWINEPNMYFPSRVFVAKFSGDGDPQWHQVYETDADYAYGFGILAQDDGSLLILGNECNYSGGYGCRTKLFKIGPDLGPVAAFDMDVREGGMPLTVQFSDLTSGGTAPYTWAWDFDDDGTVDATDPNPLHTYESRGTYSVRLDIIDGNGMTDSFVCEDCVLAYYTGIYTDSPGVEITGFAVTDDAAADPETYDFQLAPDGLDEGGAFGFTLEATGPDGSHAFRITFPSPYDPGMTLYKLPDWDVIPYTVIDAYTIEVVLDIVDGELDPAFVLAATLPLKSLTIDVAGDGTTDPPPGTTSYFVDDTLTIMLTAIPEACWSLDQWNGAVTGSDNPISVVLNKYSGDTSVTAHFVASALIGVDDDCDGDVDGSDLAALVAQGAAITAEDVAALAAFLGEIE